MTYWRRQYGDIAGLTREDWGLTGAQRGYVDLGEASCF